MSSRMKRKAEAEDEERKFPKTDDDEEPSDSDGLSEHLSGGQEGNVGTSSKTRTNSETRSSFGKRTLLQESTSHTSQESVELADTTIASRVKVELAARFSSGGSGDLSEERSEMDLREEASSSRRLRDVVLNLPSGRRIHIGNLTSEELEASLPPCMCRLASLPLEDMHGSTVTGRPASDNDRSTRTAVNTDFDWVWDNDAKAKSCIELSRDRTEVRFHTNYSLGTASARSNQPLVRGQNYWEIKMVSPVYGTDMMIGVGTCKVDPEKYSNQFCSMLGADKQEESCGLSYLGDFYYGGRKMSFCSRFGQGAVIGVHLDLWTGSVSYYKNGVYLGIACKGLKGREWYPMVSSTAAKSSMCLIRTASFQSSLQYLCCRTLRESIPDEMDVLDVLDMAPGLKKFLKNNLYWLLSAQSSSNQENRTQSQDTQTRYKRRMSLELSVKKLGERR